MLLSLREFIPLGSNSKSCSNQTNYCDLWLYFLFFLPISVGFLVACRTVETPSDVSVISPQSVSIPISNESAAVSNPPKAFVPTKSGKSIQAGTCFLHLEIARTPDERARGLMNRPMLDQNRGMLFVYEDEASLKFWMLDTLFPLDILFLDSKGSVVDIQTMIPQPGVSQESLQIYYSREPAQFALEVNNGIAAICGLIVGSIIDLSQI